MGLPLFPRTTVWGQQQPHPRRSRNIAHISNFHAPSGYFLEKQIDCFAKYYQGKLVPRFVPLLDLIHRMMLTHHIRLISLLVRARTRTRLQEKVRIWEIVNLGDASRLHPAGSHGD